jgi:hypothetical protein
MLPVSSTQDAQHDTGDTALSAANADVRRSQEQWRAARGYLNSSRHELAVAAQHLYPSASLVAGTPLLTRPGWLPEAPVELGKVTLSWQDDAPPAEPPPGPAGILPLRDAGTRFGSYADALGELDRPGMFEDRSCYRLLDASVMPGAAALGFGPGRYFDLVNTCEAVAHEYAAAAAAAAAAARSGAASPPGLGELPLRSQIGDPTDLLRRPVMVSICTLVLRAEAHGAGPAAAMLLHWRDAARVASGGGLYQVAPCGTFQPSDDAGWNQANDFSLWRSIVRELSEELLGADENYHSDVAPIAYERWPLYAELSRARDAGNLRVYWLGLGVDPLTLAADMLTAAVFDAGLFDTVFSRLVSANDEGRLVTSPGADGPATGVAFREESVERFAAREPMQAAGAALLRIAWASRGELLG